MMKALVIGGRTGIGLAMMKFLIKSNWFLEIFDRYEAKIGVVKKNAYIQRYIGMLSQ